jgi:hypothetical protein
MRALILLVALSSGGLGQGFVRPWVVKPPAKGPGLHSPFLEAAARQRFVPPPQVEVRRMPVSDSLREVLEELPWVLTPCTTFPGNPVFIIRGDQVTMRKLDR